jgi:hypothetical protein
MKYRKDSKLLYANVNLKDVNFMTPFNARVFPNCLAFATEESLIIGPMDALQRLHIRSIPLGEQPRRLAYQKSSHVYAVATIKYDPSDERSGGETHLVRLFDDQTFESIHSIQLDAWENVASLISTKFAGDPNDYFVVGTAIALPDEPEPSKGHILIFRVADRKLVPVARQATKGAVYTLSPFQGRLLAGINSKVQLYRWQTSGMIGTDGVTGMSLLSTPSSASSSSSSTLSSDSKESKREISDSKTPKKSVTSTPASSSLATPLSSVSASTTPSFRLVPEVPSFDGLVLLYMATVRMLLQYK